MKMDPASLYRTDRKKFDKFREKVLSGDNEDREEEESDDDEAERRQRKKEKKEKKKAKKETEKVIQKSKLPSGTTVVTEDFICFDP